MPWDRARTEAALDRLAAMVGDLRREHADDGDFCVAFAGEADLIEDSAAADDRELVRDRIRTMLEGCGMWAGEDAD